MHYIYTGIMLPLSKPVLTTKITAGNNSPWQFAGQEPILAVLE
ncbi:MAG: hypothetical protein SOX71_11015 [Candidatus Faecousia sp.]|nr:hypothetical protein [Candidatus Faecousia sp.]